MNFRDLLEKPQEIAKAIAQEKHAYQFRKFSKEPYFKHPSRVAGIIERLTSDDDIIAAAYLHDTVEDTKTSLKELDAVFGKRITKLVKELTSVKQDQVRIGKADYLLKKMNTMSSDALLIKLADRLDNVSDFNKASRKFIDKYIKETYYILENLTARLSSKHRTLIQEIITQLQIWEK